MRYMGGSGRCVYNEIVAEPLTRKNYEQWFECVRIYLVAQDLWEVVDGSNAIPPEDDEHKEDFVRWRRMNAATLHAIHISCSPRAFSHIKGVSQAKDAWHILNHTCNSPEPETESSLKFDIESDPKYKSDSESESELEIASQPNPEPEPEPESALVPEPAELESMLEVDLESESELGFESESEQELSPLARFEPKSKVQPDPEFPPQVMGEQVDFNVAVLYNAICDNDWWAAKAFLDEHPTALTAMLTSRGQTALHVAAQLRHVGIVEKLVRLVPPQSLEIVNVNGFTPLTIAALYNGDTRIAKCMVDKNSNILGIPTKKKSLPVMVAFSKGHKEMGRYLYSATPSEYLKQRNGRMGQRLLRWCFLAGDLDVALDLLKRCDELPLATTNIWGGPIMDIAAMPSASFSRRQLVFWKRWIYNIINIPSNTTNFVRVDIQQEDHGEIVQGLGLLRKFISNAYNLLGVTEIYELKLLHARAAQILSLLCKNVYFIHNMKQDATNVLEALFRAAREGNVEFVVQVSKAYPQLILLHSKLGWNVFFYAVEYRQAEVFNLIHGLSFKNSLASKITHSGKTLLHVAGKLAPSFQLNRISGPALQMQKELQWFKEVESMVPKGFKGYRNHNGMQPIDIFKENHSELRKEGEKWMKETASSCSVVGALIVTIMFAVAFTVPGGNDQNSGYPIFLKEKLFVLFIISDTLSLFSSSTSVLMFLGIFTSRYAEEDFRISLPTKLIIGLSALFWSIVTMMITFSSYILIMLQHAYSWSLILPIIMPASIPVTLFVLLQFPLLVQMISCTYSPGIFNRNVKQWL